jgi:hypothetical protein
MERMGTTRQATRLSFVLPTSGLSYPRALTRSGEKWLADNRIQSHKGSP